MHTDEHQHREWLASLVDLSTARVVVDLGCGRGADLALLSNRCPPTARLVGLDSSEEKLRDARLKVPDARVDFVHHDLDSPLPFGTGSIDVAFSNNLLECVADGQALLREVHRILRPQGQIIFAHWDWDSQTFDGPDQSLVRRAIHAWCDWKQPWMANADGWMGRRLWSAFRTSQLFDGNISARVLTNTTFAPPWYGHARLLELHHLVTEGLLEQRDYDHLLATQQELAAQSRFFYSITGYAYVGRRLDIRRAA